MPEEALPGPAGRYLMHPLDMRVFDILEPFGIKLLFEALTRCPSQLQRDTGRSS